MKRLLGGAGAAIGLKVLSGFAVAAAAATVAVAATGVATTGSLSPSDWGQQVTVKVQTCKDTLRAQGTQGIGQCVSQFAKQHGPLVRGHANGNGNGNSNGNSNGNGHGNSSGHGNSGKSSGHGNSGNGGAPLPKVTTEPPVTQESQP